jgi:hypothetical protein
MNLLNENIFTKKIEGLMIKLLPILIDRYESKHGFKLPNTKALNVSGFLTNPWKVYEGTEQPRFNHIGVKIEIEVKDGRIGRLKKIIIDVFKKILESLDYKYSEVYIEFIKTSELEEQKIEKLEGLIFRVIYNVNYHFLVKNIIVNPVIKNRQIGCMYDVQVIMDDYDLIKNNEVNEIKEKIKQQIPEICNIILVSSEP